MNCRQANALPIKDVASVLGLQLSSVKREDAYYYASSRKECHASLHVNYLKNLWYDFGERIGGGVVDLVIHVLKIGRKEALEYLDHSCGTVFSFHQQNQTSLKNHKEEHTRFVNVKVNDIASPDLLEYMALRGIPENVLRAFCKEISYDIAGTSYHFRAVGFENQSGGYELRSGNFKACFGKKDISLIGNMETPIIRIYEGFIDFLSWYVLMDGDTPGMNLVLNSVINVKKACVFMKDKKASIECYLDNDYAGKKAMEQILVDFPHAEDMSWIYRDAKDLNDFLRFKKLRYNDI